MAIPHSVDHFCDLAWKYGPSGSPTEITADYNGDFIDLDDATKIWSDAPIPQPSGAAKYSYEIWLRLKCKRKPKSAITTIKFYSDDWRPDYPKNLVEIFVGTTATYVTPVRTVSSVATANVHTTHYSAATALSITGSLSAIGDYSNYIVFQLKASVGAGKVSNLFIPMHFRMESTE